MKKKITKLFTIIALSLMISMPKVNAATTITVDNTKKGTTDINSALVTNTANLTITNVVAGDTLNAYKILDAYYNQATNVITYEFTTEFKNFLNQSETYETLTLDQYYQLTSGNTTSGTTKTTSTLDKLASAYAAYIKKNNATGLNMTVTGTNAVLTAQAGTYLVLPTVTNRVYAVMVGNLDFAAEGTAWNLTDKEIVAKVSDAGVTKSVGSVGYGAGSFTIGSAFNYSLVATVPSYPTNATNKKYVLTDTLSAGLTFGGLNKMTIKDGDTTFTNEDGRFTDSTGNTVATVTFQDQVLTIVFDVDYINSTRIDITYQAVLNENAVLGSAGNGNQVVLEYSNDPYGTGTYTTDPTSSEATAYTYGLELFVYDVDDNTIKLPNATFDIYADAALTKKVGTITTNNDGIAIYKGLAAGTYYLKETSTPTGYSLIRDAISVEILADGSVTNPESGEGYTRKEIPQAKVGVLPSTGGIGTIAFTIIGLIVLISAISLVVVYRKNKNKEEAQA